MITIHQAKATTEVVQSHAIVPTRRRYIRATNSKTFERDSESAAQSRPVSSLIQELEHRWSKVNYFHVADESHESNDPQSPKRKSPQSFSDAKGAAGKNSRNFDVPQINVILDELGREISQIKKDIDQKHQSSSSELSGKNDSILNRINSKFASNRRAS